MQNEVGMPEYTIIAFIAIIFVTGIVVVFKFMRGGKK